MCGGCGWPEEDDDEASSSRTAAMRVAAAWTASDQGVSWSP